MRQGALSSARRLVESVAVAFTRGALRTARPAHVQKLIVFLKAPRLGKVKTRLAASIGAEDALAAYRQLVASVLGNVERLPNVELRFTPDDARAEIEPLLHSRWSVAPQGGGDLGQRLLRAFEQAQAEGARRVAVIGSDCPAVNAQDILCAWSALAGKDVVLGPTTDGGYWLIAAREPYPELFTGIPWSTPDVFGATLTRAAEAGLSVEILRTLRDVDTAEDWRHYAANANPPCPPR